MVSKMEAKKQKRTRRSFTAEFKAGAVRLVLDEGKTVAQVARDLDLTQSALGGWVKQARADRSKGKSGLTTEERAELSQLRKDNRQLKMERDLLKNHLAPTAACWTRNSLAHTVALPEGSGRPLFGAQSSPLKNMVRGWSAHLTVVTPFGDPV